MEGWLVYSTHANCWMDALNHHWHQYADDIQHCYHDRHVATRMARQATGHVVVRVVPTSEGCSGALDMEGDIELYGLGNRRRP